MSTYEERLSSNLEWALTEGSLFFENRGAVQAALKKIAARLDELGIPYAVAGGMALFAHGFRRFTEDVDLLVTEESLKEIHRRLAGLGYRPTHPNSKNLKDTESGVRIEFLVTGRFPGDGKPKSISFPDPVSVSVEVDGIRYANLETLVALKLASGMTGAGRKRDIGDVEQLIQLLNLPADFAEKLDPYVQEEFRKVWRSIHQSERRFLTAWRDSALTSKASSLAELVELLGSPGDRLHQLLADGAQLDAQSNLAKGLAVLFTTDPAVAKKYDMVPAEDFFLPDEAS